MFLDPFHIFPTFELDHNFIGIHIFIELQVDLPVDRLTRKVESLVNFDEDLTHWINKLLMGDLVGILSIY